MFFFIIIVCPREFFDYKFLSQDIVKNFFYPTTGDYAIESFFSSIKTGTGNSRYLPYWLFVPYQANGINLGASTEIVGLSVLIFLVNFQFTKVKKIILASLIFFILAIPLGQSIGRFFIEPFLWLIVGSLSYLNLKKNLLFKIFDKLIIINSLVILSVILFTIVNFLPGILSINKYTKILDQYANGHSLYSWANKNLPKNSTILTTHRSFLFSEKPFISYNFRLYINTQEELDYYIKLLIKKKPTHILYNGFDHNRENDVLKNCRGKLIAEGKNVHSINPRNPFNNDKVYYNTYIYEIDLDKLKECKK